MTQAFDTAVYVGRVQPFLNAHHAALRAALEAAAQCVVVIAGGRQAPSPRNPLSAAERAALIAASLDAQDRARVRIVAVRDDYDGARWAAAVRRCAAAAGGARVALAHEPGLTLPDALDDWVRLPAGEPPAEPPLRERLFAAGAPAAVLQAARPELAPGGHAWLAAWIATPAFARLAGEWRALQEMKAEWAGSPYTPIFATVDTVVQCAGHVLVIERGRDPGRGLLAVPGGFLEASETVLESALRELDEETGLDVARADLLAALRGVHVFDAPQRSQRGRVLTHAHFFDLGERPLPAIRAGDDAAGAFWMPLAEAAAAEARFHDDHFLILDHFLRIAPDEDCVPADTPPAGQSVVPSP